MRPRIYSILSEAVADGALAGVRRAYKHTNTPSEEDIAQCVEDSIMLEICEWFDFDDEATE